MVEFIVKAIVITVCWCLGCLVTAGCLKALQDGKKNTKNK